MIETILRYDSAVALSVERLNPGEGDRWRRIRLQALEEAPYAFGTTVAEASRWPSSRWEQQVVDFATPMQCIADCDDESPIVAVDCGARFPAVVTGARATE